MSGIAVVFNQRKISKQRLTQFFPDSDLSSPSEIEQHDFDLGGMDRWVIAGSQL